MTLWVPALVASGLNRTSACGGVRTHVVLLEEKAVACILDARTVFRVKIVLALAISHGLGSCRAIFDIAVRRARKSFARNRPWRAFIIAHTREAGRRR